MKRNLTIFWLFAWLVVPLPLQAATPYDTLEQITRALNASDETLFEQSINLDAIIEDGLNSFVAQASGAGALLPAPVVMFLQSLQSPLIAPVIISEAKNFVLSGVSSGAFGGGAASGAPTRGILGPLLAGASMAKKEIYSTGDARLTDDGYIIPFTVYDYGNGNFYHVEGLFDPESHRLESLVNMDELVRQILEESVS